VSRLHIFTFNRLVDSVRLAELEQTRTDGVHLAEQRRDGSTNRRTTSRE
jgi:hypothetical protein